MTDGDDTQPADTLEGQDDRESSEIILGQLAYAASEFQKWQSDADRIEKKFSQTKVSGDYTWRDDELDIFWASTEILKPAIYSRPPVPVVSTRFSIRDPFLDQASEILERAISTTLDQTVIDDVMKGVRDDLIMSGRGAAWVRYEDDDGKRVIVEHLDRTDFLHEPARKWADVGWVARRAWMTKAEMKERFSPTSGDAYAQAEFTARKDFEKHGMTDGSEKAGVWEVWSRTDDRVYWVSDGVNVILDDDEPHLHLARFFPCPKPAFGTLKCRSLIPVPDFARYQSHLDQINDLTSRIYGLLDQIRVKGLIPAGGDVAQAVETALRDNDDDSIFIPVPAGAFTNGQMIQYLPLDQFATTVQGLLQARTQLMQDFYQLSGISDIMRGATDAQETLGAQQLKSQYGSIRVRDKIDALVAHARDICAIAGEIIAANYDADDLLDLSCQKMPTDADIKKQIGQVNKWRDEAIQHIDGQAEKVRAEMRVQQDLEASQPPQGQPQQIPPQGQPGVAPQPSMQGVPQ
ncbi:MAG: hypothetical protein ABF968_04875 [Acetobacter sp.]|uniref:hypothetical protein n=1 Tax=Acetobacter sp. TaxID=440 RepID=UPI0039E80402